MAKIYHKQILNEKITIDDVPLRWRAQVEGLLNS